MKIVSRLIPALVLMVALQANAALELELTRGVDKAMSIALEAFAGAEQIAGAEVIFKVIRTDLQNSGRFNVMTGQPALTESLLDFWRTKQVDTVVSGRIAKKDKDSIEISFQLNNTVGDDNQITRRTVTVTKPDYRRLAHRISDIIYQELTGNRGIFSTKIAYVIVKGGVGHKRQYALEIADMDGYNAKTLLNTTAPIMSPMWSPDGHKIAYVSFENRRSSIYVVDVISGKRRLISRFKGINGAPAWSPDGKYLAFVLSKSGSPNIYLLNMTSKKLRRLTSGWAINTEPSFSPDGGRILFTSDRGGSPQIYQLDIETGSIARVTFDGDYNASAKFLMHGDAFVLLHKRAGMFNIAIQELENGQIRELTLFGQTESPSPSPNSQMVLFTSKGDGVRMLNVVSVDGKVRMRLPSPDGEVQEPAWSPFIR